MTQMNLLPWREQARQASRLRFATTLFTYLVGSAVLVLMLHFYMAALIVYQQKRIGFLQIILAQAKMEVETLNKQKVQTKQVEAKLKFIMNLRAKSFRAVHLLNELSSTIPSTITLLGVTREGDVVTLEGNVESDLEITKLMKQLAILPGFSQPVLTEISAKKDSAETMRYFRLKVNQQ